MKNDAELHRLARRENRLWQQLMKQQLSNGEFPEGRLKQERIAAVLALADAMGLEGDLNRHAAVYFYRKRYGYSLDPKLGYNAPNLRHETV